jgi:hypothetical protein
MRAKGILQPPLASKAACWHQLIISGRPFLLPLPFQANPTENTAPRRAGIISISFQEKPALRTGNARRIWQHRTYSRLFDCTAVHDYSIYGLNLNHSINAARANRASVPNAAGALLDVSAALLSGFSRVKLSPQVPPEQSGSSHSHSTKTPLTIL